MSVMSVSALLHSVYKAEKMQTNIHSVTLDVDFGKWGEIDNHEKRFGCDINLSEDPNHLHVITLSAIRGKDMLLLYAFRNKSFTPSPFRWQVCLIDQRGEKQLSQNSTIGIEYSCIIASWNIKEVNSIIHNEDQLIARCTFLPEKKIDLHKISITKHMENCAYNEATGESSAVKSRFSRVDISDDDERNVVDFLKTLSKDLESYLNDQIDTDCILKTKDVNFPAHRAVLSSRSQVFLSMFHHDTSERRTGEVNIQDVESTILRNVLHFIYAGKVKGLTPSTAVRMFAAADKYALQDLRQACLDYLMQNLDIENFCDAAVLAHTHGEEMLEIWIVNFIMESFEDIQESDEWEGFLANNLPLASKYLSAALLASKKNVRK